jgi:hypothetical protein
MIHSFQILEIIIKNFNSMLGHLHLLSLCQIRFA